MPAAGKDDSRALVEDVVDQLRWQKRWQVPRRVSRGIAFTAQSLVLGALARHGQGQRMRKEEVSLFEHAAQIGEGMVYEATVYGGDMRIVQYGTDILGAVQWRATRARNRRIHTVTKLAFENLRRHAQQKKAPHTVALLDHVEKQAKCSPQDREEIPDDVHAAISADEN